jgi:chorismate mutase
MKKNSSKNNYIKVIDKIEKIRKNNNTNWMDILRVAYTYAPKKTAKIMAKIYRDDSKISKLAKNLSQ